MLLPALFLGCLPVPAQSLAPAPPRVLTLESGTVVRLSGSSATIRTADGRTGLRKTDGRIRLANRTFDPLRDPDAAHRWPATGRTRLIQLETQPLEEYREPLAELGVRVHRFVPGQTLIAHVPAEAEDGVRALPFVRWSGPLAAEDRLEASLLAGLLAGGLPARVEVTLQLTERCRVRGAEVVAAVEALGGEASVPAEEGYLVEATLGQDALRRIAALDHVLWVERAAARAPASAPIDQVRVDGGMDVLEQRTGFTGRGVRGEVFDEGLDLDHPDFQHHRPILHGPNHPSWGHGTGTHGAVFGDGATDPLARGLLPEGQSVFASFRRFTDRYLHTAELLEPPFEVVFQTNSWGNGPSPRSGYPSLSFEMDDLIQRYDLLTCQAFGNAGRRAAFRQAWAKNVVTVGGITHGDTLTTADDVWGGRASAGPAADGRIKPDLSYWNDRVHSTKPNGGHGNIGGTSASTPCVAGHFGAFYQMWHEERFGNVAPGPDVFSSRPRSSTARALLLHTAQAYPFAGVGDDLERTTQGWGRPDLAHLDDVRADLLIVDGWTPLRNLESARYAVEVEEGEPRLRATLVYTDPPGTSAAALHRINDLSLRLTAPDGTVYWGNQGMLAGNVTRPAGRPDTRNTVEQVWLEDPAPGRWTVEVLADEVAQDAHAATPTPDATFSLAVSPIRPIVQDLGRGHAPGGRDRAPVLEARGSFVAGAPWRFEVTGAAPGRPAFLVLGPAPRDPARDAGPRDRPTVVPMSVDDTGRARLAGTFAAEDLERPFTAQVWLRGSRGRAASNVLLVRPPEVP